MENAVYNNLAETWLDLQCMSGQVLLEENYFATVPMLSITTRPPVGGTNEQERDEEFHTLFEEAINERAQQVSRQLNNLSTSGHVTAVAPLKTTDPLLQTYSTRTFRLAHFWGRQRRVFLLLCLGLSLLLLGFDLMGLLILSR